ncbi:hypothetical protein Pelo_983 [Pelomyxa schiedti]|nr:hypothetical protein Pelo_983 [Pelomyxa schiedti]
MGDDPNSGDLMSQVVPLLWHYLRDEEVAQLLYVCKATRDVVMNEELWTSRFGASGYDKYRELGQSVLGGPELSRLIPSQRAAKLVGACSVMNDFVRRYTSDYRWQWTHKKTMMILGKNGVGKSAIVHRFVQDLWVPGYDSEIESWFSTTLDFPFTFRIDLFDTNCSASPSALQLRVWHTANVIVIVYAVDDSSSLEEAQLLYVETRKLTNAPVVLCGNKADTAGIRVTTQQARHVAKSVMHGAPLVLVSALTSHNINILFAHAIMETLNDDRLHEIEHPRLPTRRRSYRCSIL